MKEDNAKEILSDRLVIADIQYEIKRMDAELEYHKTKVTIFDQAIKSKGRVAIQNLQKEAKNMLKFNLTEDLQVPLETKQANSVLMKVTKLRNKRGEIAMRVDEVVPLDYEFECEALADYAYQVDKDKSNK